MSVIFVQTSFFWKMQSAPLVSVICLCYNHANYVEASIRSVLDQTYDMVELIVVDDGSRDESREVIARLAAEYGFDTIFNGENMGNCKAFNKALARSHGNYIIDLAADDILMQDRIERGVWVFSEVGEEFGVHFCDVALAGPAGEDLGTHYKRDASGQLLEEIPAGDVYKDVLERYFISTPSMMMKRSVFDALGGYDESLSYEDFDFWVRAARKFKFAFTDDILVKKYVLPGSMSASQKKYKNPHLLSTARVCEKALQMNENEKENHALARRCSYELKWALITENWEAAGIFCDVLKTLGVKPVMYQVARLVLTVKPHWYEWWRRFIK